MFDIETANKKAERDGVELSFIPGKEEDTPENQEFKERVRMFQYLITANEGDNNKEIIWGQRIDSDVNNGGEATDSRLPNRVVKKSDGSWQVVGQVWHLPCTLYSISIQRMENFRNRTLTSIRNQNGIAAFMNELQAPNLQLTASTVKM